MINKETVCAVVVTYNRKDMLIECLKALRQQIRPIDALFIIDNNSTDNTEELLKEKGYIDELPPEKLDIPWEREFKIENKENNNFLKIFYIRMHRNTGGAGGFYEGSKRGHEKGYDWLWLMDDDGLPDVHCLEELLLHKHTGDFLSPFVVDIENKKTASFHLRYNGQELKNIEDAIKASKDSTLDNIASPFNGVLFSSKLLSTIGYPKKDFFIWGDEIEYMFRTRKYGFKIKTVVTAIHYHPTSRMKITDKFGTHFAFQDMKLKDLCYYRNMAYNYFKYKKIKFVVYILKYTYFFLIMRKLDIKNYIDFLSASKDGVIENFENHKKYL